MPAAGRIYLHSTLTGFANLRHKDDIIRTVQTLAGRTGRERVVWRYDPILLNDKYNIDNHMEWFGKTVEKLAPCVKRCVISFIDMYAKMKKNTAGLNLRKLTERITGRPVKAGRKRSNVASLFCVFHFL